MDSYYKTIAIYNPQLYHDLKKIKTINSYDEIFTLILTGDPEKYIDTLFKTNEFVSIRHFYHSITGKSHRLIYGRYRSYMGYCVECMDSIAKPVVKISSTYNHKCNVHFINTAVNAATYSVIFGNQYFKELYHHYYLFSHCDLVNDIKDYIQLYFIITICK